MDDSVVHSQEGRIDQKKIATFRTDGASPSSWLSPQVRKEKVAGNVSCDMKQMMKETRYQTSVPSTQYNSGAIQNLEL